MDFFFKIFKIRWFQCWYVYIIIFFIKKKLNRWWLWYGPINNYDEFNMDMWTIMLTSIWMFKQLQWLLLIHVDCYWSVNIAETSIAGQLYHNPSICKRHFKFSDIKFELIALEVSSFIMFNRVVEKLPLLALPSRFLS